MKKEDCFKKVRERLTKAKANQDKDYGFYYGMELGIRQALEIFGMLEETEHSQELDYAAEEFEDFALTYSQTDFPTNISYKQTFIAGAKWQAEQGVTIEKTVGQLESVCAGHPTFYHGFEISELDADFLNSKEVGYGDKVIVQIRKK